MNKRRLLTLAKFLEEKVPAKKFDMYWWGQTTDGLSFNGRKPTDCGTTACACGWATVIPLFARAGLRLRQENYRDGLFHSPRRATIVFDRKTRGNAVQAFFNISFDAEQHLFAELSYPRKQRHSPKAVALRIRRFVETNGKNAP